MKKLILLLFIPLVFGCGNDSKKEGKERDMVTDVKEVDNYYNLEGLYSADVESILGKPDAVYIEDQFYKVYFYKEILETSYGKKCDLFLYFDGVNTGRFTNDIVGTIEAYSCQMK